MAGLLDALFDPSFFNGTGGLLSRLGPMTATLPQSQGFPEVPQQPNPIALGGYQMPRVGNPDLYQPQQAMTPPNAQPAQGQMQEQPQPSFLQGNPGGFGAGVRGVVNNLHNGPIGALVGGIGSAFGMQDDSQRTARDLFNAYQGAGLNRNQALLATLNPKLADNLLGIGGTDDIKEYQFAKREDPTLTFSKFMLQKKANQGEYSLNPVYGTNDKGETVLMQTGKSGEAIQTKLPPGVKVSSGIEKVDLGTHWALYDKKSGVPLGTQPKDLQGKEAAEERGKAQGQAQAAVPGAIADAEATKAKIDELIKHEGLSSIVGSFDQYRPSWTLGEKGNDALARYKQLQGQAFLQAYNLLKGGGAITDIEGKKAESAMARLDRAQSEETFKQALQDFRDAIEAGVNKLKMKANGTTSAPLAPANNLKSKYGLD